MNKKNSQCLWHIRAYCDNWMAHAYAELDESIVWEAVTNDIPRLREFCNETLKNS